MTLDIHRPGVAGSEGGAAVRGRSPCAARPARELDPEAARHRAWRRTRGAQLVSAGIGPCEAPPPESGIGQARLFEQLFGVFARLASLRPLVLGFEDMHWADRSMRHLLRFLVCNMQTEPIALIATYRVKPHADRGHPFGRSWPRSNVRQRFGGSPWCCSHAQDFADHVDSLLSHTPNPRSCTACTARSEGNALKTEGSSPRARTRCQPRCAMRWLFAWSAFQMAQQVVRVARRGRGDASTTSSAEAIELPKSESAGRRCGGRRAARVGSRRPRASRAVPVRHALLREAAYRRSSPRRVRSAPSCTGLRPAAHDRSRTAGRAAAAAELAHHGTRLKRWIRHCPHRSAPARKRCASTPSPRPGSTSSARAGDLGSRVIGRARGARPRRDCRTGRPRRQPSWRTPALGEARARRTRPAPDRVGPCAHGTAARRSARHLWEGGRGDEAYPLSLRALEIMPSHPSRGERAVAQEAHARLMHLGGRTNEGAQHIDGRPSRWPEASVPQMSRWRLGQRA